jgi:phosphatidyl-myo-inositol dimannoside synthase
MVARPRVLVLTPDFPPMRGGIQSLLHRLIRNADGLDWLVVTHDSEGAAEFDSREDLDVVRVGSARGGRLVSRLLLNQRALVEAARFRPHVVLSGHIVTAPAASLLRRTLRVPVIQYLYALEVAAKPRLAAYAVGRADATIAISRYTRELALSAGAKEDRIAIVPPGVDLPGELPDRRPDPQAPPTVVTVARLSDRYKGHDVMMRALPLIRARVPAARWVIVGDGPLRQHLEALATAEGVSEAVRFAGVISDSERDAWLGRSHVFAMPSRLPARGLAGEGFGIVYLEAGARGLPVVAGKAGGALDAVVDGRTGLLVDPQDHVALADAISGLLLDGERAERMGAAGTEHARAHAWPVVAARVEQLVRGTLATGPA